MIVTLNLLWRELVETNERRFDLLLRILTISRQSKLKITIILILGAMKHIFRNNYSAEQPDE